MLRFLTILALVVTTIKLNSAGLLSPGYVLIALLAGVAIMVMGPKMRMAAIAIVGLILFARLHSGGEEAAMTGLVGQLLALAMALTGIYMILGGWKRGPPHVSKVKRSQR